MVPVSLVVRSRAMQGMRAGVASWRWSLSLPGASALWPMHQAGQAVVGGVLFSSVWSAGAAIGLPFLGLSVCGGAVRGRVKRRDGPDGRWRAEGERGRRATTLLQPSWVVCSLCKLSGRAGVACLPQDVRCIAQGISHSEGMLFENFISSKARRFRLSESWT